MTDLLNDPFVQSSLLPLLLGVAAVGGLWAVGGRNGRALAPAGIALAFLALFVLVVGLPAFPPPSSMGKLFWSVAAGLALGLAADTLGITGRAASAAVAAWLVLALGWIAGPALDSAASFVPLAVLLAVGAWIAVTGASPSGEARPAAPAAVLLALTLAVGVTALIGSSASLAQLGLGLTAATGGFLLWNWPRERHVWGVSGRVALGLPLLLAAILALYTQVQAATLLLALPALLAEPLRRRLPIPDAGFGPALRTVAVTVLAVLPALAAIAAAYLLSGGEASPY